MIAVLNDLEEKSSNILNGHVRAHVTEKMWTALGPEFGKDASKTEVIIRALFSLMSEGEIFRCHIARCMESMGYESYKAYGCN